MSYTTTIHLLHAEHGLFFMRAHGMHARAMRAWDVLNQCVYRRSSNFVRIPRRVYMAPSSRDYTRIYAIYLEYLMRGIPMLALSRLAKLATNAFFGICG